MTLFADDAPAPPPRRRRTWIGGVLTIAAIAGIATVAFLPSPYVLEMPGPVFDTLGQTTVDSKEVPLIDIPDAKTYPTDGSLDMLTVTIDGSREQPVNWLDTATAWLDPSKAVVPVDEIYPLGETADESSQESAAEMQGSQRDAIAAAERSLGYTVPSVISVATVVDDEPASGVLKTNDIIRSVGGADVTDVDSLRAAIAKHGTSSPLRLGIERDGKDATVSITPTTYQGSTVIGVVLTTAYTFPVKVTIQLQDVGGPSAGQMFALGIIDKLTPGSLTGGKKVAGTGTIDADGAVGAIGGIRQKMYGAQRAGATYFLAPESNCDEVVGHVPSGLTVFAVSTLDDSLADLKVVAAGGDTSSLATCH